MQYGPANPDELAMQARAPRRRQSTADAPADGSEDLLAGIEEFRNQLARLKTESLTDGLDVATPLASQS